MSARWVVLVYRGARKSFVSRSFVSCVVLRAKRQAETNQSGGWVPPDERLKLLKSAERKVAVFAGVSLLICYFALKSTLPERRDRPPDDPVPIVYAIPAAAKKRQKLMALTSNLPRPLVVAGPSGSGKSTLLKQLFAAYPERFGFSVSHTTRNPRQGEVDGREYHFTTRKTMTKAIAAGEFIESAEYSGNMYGTSKKSVRDVQAEGRVCVLDIDMQGVRNLKGTDLNPVYVLIKPPSLEVLEQRLRDRKTETDESLRKRLEVAKTELDYATQPGVFDQVIVNDNLDEAYEAFCKYIEENIGLKSN